jgi:hypothetical protein
VTSQNDTVDGEWEGELTLRHLPLDEVVFGKGMSTAQSHEGEDCEQGVNLHGDDGKESSEINS